MRRMDEPIAVVIDGERFVGAAMIRSMTTAICDCPALSYVVETPSAGDVWSRARH